MDDAAPPEIGLLNESPLHAGLKAWYARPDDRLEVPVEGFVVDIVRGDLLIEVQTGSFASIRRKLHDLVPRYRVRLIYPIAAEKWLLKLPQEEGDEAVRRKSPKRGRVADVFSELVSFPELLAEPHFALEVALIREEEVRRYDGRRRWRRRGWVTEERRLLEVVTRRRFACPADLGALLPDDLPPRFTTADMARAMDIPRRLAQQAAYCLRRLGVILQEGKQGRSRCYRAA